MVTKLFLNTGAMTYVYNAKNQTGHTIKTFSIVDCQIHGPSFSKIIFSKCVVEADLFEVFKFKNFWL